MMNNCISQRYNTFEDLSAPDEEWKTIDGTDGEYFISSFGRVVHLQKDKSLFLLSPWIDKQYERVDIKQNGEKQKGVYVHRLVA